MASNANKPGKNRHFRESLAHALVGLLGAFKAERNLRYQAAMGAVVVLAGFLLCVSFFEWLVLILVMSAVLVTEMLNTVVEALVDWHSGGSFDRNAGRIKDLAAGASLLCATGAVVVGVLIFGRHLLIWFL